MKSNGLTLFLFDISRSISYVRFDTCMFFILF
jgi:hypothetical protein